MIWSRITLLQGADVYRRVLKWATDHEPPLTDFIAKLAVEKTHFEHCWWPVGIEGEYSACSNGRMMVNRASSAEGLWRNMARDSPSMCGPVYFWDVWLPSWTATNNIHRHIQFDTACQYLPTSGFSLPYLRYTKLHCREVAADRVGELLEELDSARSTVSSSSSSSASSASAQLSGEMQAMLHMPMPGERHVKTRKSGTGMSHHKVGSVSSVSAASYGRRLPTAVAWHERNNLPFVDGRVSLFERRLIKTMYKHFVASATLTARNLSPDKLAMAAVDRVWELALIFPHAHYFSHRVLILFVALSFRLCADSRTVAIIRSDHEGVPVHVLAARLLRADAGHYSLRR